MADRPDTITYTRLSDDPDVTATNLGGIGVRITIAGCVNLIATDLATACDLNERIAVELSRLLADARQDETQPLGGAA